MTQESADVTEAQPGVHFLVGDVFAEFARHEGVHTVSQLVGRIRSGAFPGGDGVGGAAGIRMTPGQGVSLFDVEYVRDTLRRHGLADRVVVDDRVLHGRAGRELAHKHRLENVLISRPRAAGTDVFESDLLVDAGNEVMSDHLTGQHMQGMLAMEAGRQMFIAVAEEAYLPADAVGSRYFVIDTFSTRYRNFLFPLPAQVRCTVLAHHAPHPTRTSFHCALALSQGGADAVEMEVRFTAFDTRISHTKETRAAQRSLEDGMTLAAAAAATAGLPVPAGARTP
ncbi:AfsA-related hotdog domain-containing protein [Streptomyces sp. NPDC058486]|uniref:AfsA-related hotdog domain-containing protein n=1 Tax=unclassified Streptomyces TaxID=2593676 RepID=UPI0036647566